MDPATVSRAARRLGGALEPVIGRRTLEIHHDKHHAKYVDTTNTMIAGTDLEKRARLPHTEGMANEVIVHRHGRVSYDFAVRQVGARLVEIGDEAGASAEEMEVAITEKTAAILYFYKMHLMEGQVPLEQAIEIGKRRGIPVIVDEVTTLCGPGELVDVVVTERGIAIHPRREDLRARVAGAGLPLTTLEALQRDAIAAAGRPPRPELDDEIVAVVQWVDGTAIDLSGTAVLDAILTEDRYARVSCEVMVTTGMVIVTGQITTKAYLDITGTVRDASRIRFICILLFIGPQVSENMEAATYSNQK